MGKSFPTWGFLIATPLNLLGNEVGNEAKLFNKVENGVDLSTPNPLYCHPYIKLEALGTYVIEISKYYIF